MEKITLNTTKRKGIPYIVNLKCECGGKFFKSEPIVFDYETQTVKHECDKCGKVINSKEIYPYTTVISDVSEEDFGTAEVYIGCENIIRL